VALAGEAEASSDVDELADEAVPAMASLTASVPGPAFSAKVSGLSPTYCPEVGPVCASAGALGARVTTVRVRRSTVVGRSELITGLPCAS
jgi:hypothetical protein